MIAILLCGFLMSAIEARFLHREAVSEESAAWIPTLVSWLGVGACALGMSRSKVAHRIAMAALALVATSGLLGLYFHTKLRPDAFLELVGVRRSVSSASEREGDGDDDDEPSFGRTNAETESESSPPALAPLSLTGLSLLGLLAIRQRR